MKPSTLASCWILVIFGAGSVAPQPSFATNEDAKFALHRVPVSGPFDGCGADSPNALGIPCSDYSVAAPVGESYVYMVVGQTGDNGVKGIQFGVDYDGRDGQMSGIDPSLTTFTYCNRGGPFFLLGDGGYGKFPNPGGSVAIVFEADESHTCYEHPVVGSFGRHVLVGFFYVYAHSEDVLRLTPDWQAHREPEVTVHDCIGESVNLFNTYYPDYYPDFEPILGRVHFGGDGSEGHTPCGFTPTRETTWGRIKAKYAEGN